MVFTIQKWRPAFVENQTKHCLTCQNSKHTFNNVNVRLNKLDSILNDQIPDSGTSLHIGNFVFRSHQPSFVFFFNYSPYIPSNFHVLPSRFMCYYTYSSIPANTVQRVNSLKSQISLIDFKITTEREKEEEEK